MGMCLLENTESSSFPPKLHRWSSPQPKGWCHSQDTHWMAPSPAQGATSPPAGMGLALRRGTGVGDIWENLFSSSLPYTR